MARTKQRRTYLPYTFPAIAVLIYRPREDGGLSKPRPRVQRATGPRLLHDSPRPADSNPRPRGRWSSALSTRAPAGRNVTLAHQYIKSEFTAESEKPKQDCTAWPCNAISPVMPIVATAEENCGIDDFKTTDKRVLSVSVLSVRVPGCQKLQMTA